MFVNLFIFQIKRKRYISFILLAKIENDNIHFTLNQNMENQYMYIVYIKFYLYSDKYSGSRFRINIKPEAKQDIKYIYIPIKSSLGRQGIY